MSGEEGRSGGASVARPVPVRSQSSSDGAASGPGTEQANQRRNLDDTLVLSLVQQYFKLAGVVLVIWIVGYLRFSVSWLMLALVIYMWREKYAKIKDAQIEIAQHASRDEKSSVLARVEDLPSWVGTRTVFITFFSLCVCVRVCFETKSLLPFKVLFGIFIFYFFFFLLRQSDMSGVVYVCSRVIPVGLVETEPCYTCPVIDLRKWGWIVLTIKTSFMVILFFGGV